MQEYFAVESERGMNDLNRALGDIRSIRRQVARSTEFRGYGPATLAATAGVAVFAAGVQSLWLRDPAQHMAAYIGIWVAAAVVSAMVIAVQTVTRSERLHSGLADEMIRMAVEQFVPCVGAGALVTVVLERSAPSAGWMLPGLWQVLFSLGVFASARFLPRAMLAVGGWYLLGGVVCLAQGGDRALSGWWMGMAFAVGQLGVAGVLYFRPQQRPGEGIMMEHDDEA